MESLMITQHVVKALTTAGHVHMLEYILNWQMKIDFYACLE